MKLCLVRHAPVAVEGLCYGRSDPQVEPVPPASLFVLQDRWRYEHLQEQARMVSSPSLRCYQLARSILRNGPPSSRLELEERFREMDFGDWEGRLWKDIPREAVDSWLQDWESLSPPGGESLQAMTARIRSGLAGLQGGEGSVWIITHAGPIRCILSLARRTSVREVFHEPVPHLEPIVVELDPEILR